MQLLGKMHFLRIVLLVSYVLSFGGKENVPRQPSSQGVTRPFGRAGMLVADASQVIEGSMILWSGQAVGVQVDWGDQIPSF